MLPEDMRYDFRALYARYDTLTQRLFSQLNVFDYFDEVAHDLTIRLTKGFFKPRPLKITAVDMACADEMGKSLKPRLVGDSLSWALLPFQGRALTDECLEDLIWRLAAGFDFVAGHKQMVSEFAVGESQWVFLKITEVVQDRPTRAGKAMLQLCFRALSGAAAGLRFSQRISYRYVVYQVARDIGFPRFQALHPLQLTGTVLLGKVFATDDLTNIVEFEATGQVKYQNDKLRKEREVCRYGHAWTCPACTRGYSGSNSCELATHPHAYVERECPLCTPRTEQLAWFDPRLQTKTCVNCREKDARRRARIN